MVINGHSHDREQIFHITSDRNIRVTVSTRHLDDFVKESPIAHVFFDTAFTTLRG